MLLKACAKPDQDLSLIRVDPVVVGETIRSFIYTGTYEFVPVYHCDVAFCKPKMTKVSLLCHCLIPWGMALHLLLFMELGRRNSMFIDAVSATHVIIVSVLELTSLN